MTSKYPNIPTCMGAPKLDFGTGGVVAFVGRTGSGKTHRLKHILKHNAHQFSYILLMGPPGTLKEYDFLEDECKTQYSEKELERLIRMHEKIYVDSGDMLKGAIIIDDCLSNPEACASHSPTFMDLAIRARKLGITIFFLVQHWHTKLTTPLIRESANYIFMCSAVDSECIRMKDTTQNGMSRGDFTKFCNHYVKGFGHLCFDNRPMSTDKIVFYPPFEVGKFKLRNFSA